MENIMIINGSPRAPKSNSKAYAHIFASHYPGETEYCNITKSNHLSLCHQMEHYSHVLLVFPLYADGIPVTLLHFLKVLEHHLPQHPPTISVLINCGFLEYWQNDLAIDMIRLFCQKTHCPIGSVLKIGSGEAILNTPFRGLAVRKIKQLAKAIASQRHRVLHVTMPLPPKMFIKASTRYWINYGKRNGVTEEEMRSMNIE